jgi:peptidyl-prolyl cis-trans isomerase C
MAYRCGNLRFAVSGMVIVISTLIVLLGVLSSHGRTTEQDVVVAIVNDHIQITKQELDAAIENYQQRRRKNFTTEEEKIALVKNLIRRQLILQQDDTAAYRNDPLIAERVQKYEDNLVIEKYLREHIVQRMEASEDELKNYYKMHRADFSSPPKVEARHILLRSRKEAEMVAEKLRQGEDFVQLAYDYSIDLPLARQGGMMAAAPIQKGEALDQIDRVLFSLNVGQVSDIVETEFGFHIIRVDKIIPPEIKTFKEVKKEIRKKIGWQRHSELYKEMTSQLEQQAEIKIFKDRLE